MVTRVPCWAYRILFWFKQTTVAGWLFFDTRTPFQVLDRQVTVFGTVTRIASAETDGDSTFDIELVEPRWGTTTLHCEVTPCTQADCPELAQLQLGDRVQVWGDHCYDPPHFGTAGGGHEIHPVRACTILT